MTWAKPLGRNKERQAGSQVLSQEEYDRSQLGITGTQNVRFEYALTSRVIAAKDIYPPPGDGRVTLPYLDDEMPLDMGGDKYWPQEIYKLPRHKKTQFLEDSDMMMPGLFYILHPEVALPAAGIYMYRMLTGDLVDDNAARFYLKKPQYTAWLVKWWNMTQLSYMTMGLAPRIPMGVQIRILLCEIVNLLEYQKGGETPKGRLPYLSFTDLEREGVYTTAFDQTRQLSEDTIPQLEDSLDRLIARGTKYPYSDMTARRICIFCDDVYGTVDDLNDHVKQCPMAEKPVCLLCNMDFGKSGKKTYAAHMLSTCRACPTRRCCVCDEDCTNASGCACTLNYFKISERIEPLISDTNLFNDRNIPLIKLILECELQQILPFGPTRHQGEDDPEPVSMMEMENEKYVSEILINKAIDHLPHILQENPNDIYFPGTRKSYTIRDIYLLADLSPADCRSWGLPDDPAALQIHTIYNQNQGERQKSTTFVEEEMSIIETDYVQRLKQTEEGMAQLREVVQNCVADPKYCQQAIVDDKFIGDHDVGRWARTFGLIGQHDSMDSRPVASRVITSTPAARTGRINGWGRRMANDGSGEDGDTSESPEVRNASTEVRPSESPGRDLLSTVDVSRRCIRRDDMDYVGKEDGRRNTARSGGERHSVGPGRQGRTASYVSDKGKQEEDKGNHRHPLREEDLNATWPQSLRCRNEWKQCEFLRFASQLEKGKHIAANHRCEAKGCEFSDEYNWVMDMHKDEIHGGDSHPRTETRDRCEGELMKSLLAPQRMLKAEATEGRDNRGIYIDPKAWQPHRSPDGAPGTPCRCQNEKGYCSRLLFSNEMEKSRHVEREHKCSKRRCDYSNEYERALLSHYKDVHEDRGCQCPICGVRCVTEAAWEMHRDLHPRCAGCKESFPSMVALEQHRPCENVRARERTPQTDMSMNSGLACCKYLMPASMLEPENSKGVNDPFAQLSNIWTLMVETNTELSPDIKMTCKKIISDAHASEMNKKADALAPESANFLNADCFDLPKFHPKNEARKVNWTHVNSTFRSSGFREGGVKLDHDSSNFNRNFVYLQSLNDHIGSQVSLNALSESDGLHLLLLYLSTDTVQSLRAYMCKNPHAVSYSDNLYGLHAIYSQIDKDQLKKMILTVPRTPLQDILSYTKVAYRLCEASALQEAPEDRSAFIEASMRRLILENVSMTVRQAIKRREQDGGRQLSLQLLQQAVRTLETGSQKSYQRATVMDPDLWLEAVAPADAERNRFKERRQKVGAVTRKGAKEAGQLELMGHGREEGNDGPLVELATEVEPVIPGRGIETQRDAHAERNNRPPETVRLPAGQGMGHPVGRMNSAANTYNARDMYNTSRNAGTVGRRLDDRQKYLEEIKKKLHLPPDAPLHCFRCGQSNPYHRASDCTIPSSENVHRCQVNPPVYLYHEPENCPHKQKVGRVNNGYNGSWDQGARGSRMDSPRRDYAAGPPVVSRYNRR